MARTKTKKNATAISTPKRTAKKPNGKRKYTKKADIAATKEPINITLADGTLIENISMESGCKLLMMLNGKQK